MRWWVAGLAGLAFGMAVGVGLTYAAMRTEPVEVRHTPDPYDEPGLKTIRVSPQDDVGKSGVVHGVMGWRFFEYPPGGHGESGDELRFLFTRPAEIRQVDISVDLNDPRLTLVEFAIGIKSERYGFSSGVFDRGADWLMHISWSGASPDEIDETAQLPDGVIVGRGEYLNVGAYLGGVGTGDPLRVSPEVVVLYRWL
jgi:hypothetical protein